jgi:dolichol-phosphate mannosyltransferase
MVPVTLRRVLVIGFVLLTALRLVLAARTELLPEEAYYWTYTQHPAWSYYDHPPMVAWIIHIGTRLLGHTEAGVRVVNLVLAALGCWLLVSTTRRWFDEAAAIWAGLLFMLTPIFAGAAFMVTPDGPLLFFWLLTLYAITRALAGRNGAGDWERHPHPDPLPHTTAASRGLGSPPAGEGKAPLPRRRGRGFR